MSIIEIACFRLESTEIEAPSRPFLAEAPQDQSVATLRFYITHGIRVLSKHSKHPFHLLQDLEDSRTVYYIGKWPSKEAYAEFNASEGRAELIKDLKGCAAVMQWKGLYEIVEYHSWESSILSGFHKSKDTMTSKVVGITRHNVSDLADFEKKLKHGMPFMEKFSGHKAAAGRKFEIPSDVDDPANTGGDVAQELGRDEVVVLGGWDSQAQYDEFRDSKDYAEFAQIRSATTWFERVSGR